MSQCRAQFSENKQNNSTPPPISIIIFPLIRIFTLPIILKKIFDCEKKTKLVFLSVLFSFLILKNNESDKKNFPLLHPGYSGRYFAFFKFREMRKKLSRQKSSPTILLFYYCYYGMIWCIFALQSHFFPFYLQIVFCKPTHCI